MQGSSIFWAFLYATEAIDDKAPNIFGGISFVVMMVLLVAVMIMRQSARRKIR